METLGCPCLVWALSRGAPSIWAKGSGHLALLRQGALPSFTKPASLGLTSTRCPAFITPVKPTALQGPKWDQCAYIQHLHACPPFSFMWMGLYTEEAGTRVQNILQLRRSVDAATPTQECSCSCFTHFRQQNPISFRTASLCSSLCPQSPGSLVSTNDCGMSRCV